MRMPCAGSDSSARCASRTTTGTTPLPPGLGLFPLRRVDDHLERAPDGWGRQGGVFLPIYQAEALWIRFGTSYPMAVKVAAGKVDAVTGEGWTDELSPRLQNYLAVPDQPWLDGFCVGKGLIRQFVAMPLGRGFTAEEQLTGAARHGWLQIVVYPMQAARYEAWFRKRSAQFAASVPMPCQSPAGPAEMGLAPGGVMRQEIYRDGVRLRSVGHLGAFPLLRAHPEQRAVSPGVRNPTTGDAVQRAGLHRGRVPWFEHYGGDLTALDGASKLAGLDSVAAMKLKKGEGVLVDNDPVQPAPPTIVRTSGAVRVREGEF